MNVDKKKVWINCFIMTLFLLKATVVYADALHEKQTMLESMTQEALNLVKSDSDTELMRSPVFIKQIYRSAREAPKLSERLIDTYANATVPGYTPISKEEATQMAQIYKQQMDVGLNDSNFSEKVRHVKEHPQKIFFDLVEMKQKNISELTKKNHKSDLSSTNQTAHSSKEQKKKTSQADEQRNRMLAHQKELRKQLGRRSFLINLTLF